MSYPMKRHLSKKKKDKAHETTFAGEQLRKTTGNETLHAAGTSQLNDI